MRALITAGATCNPIDAIRFLSASSTGRTGAGIARALVRRGIPVHLLGSVEALLRAPDLPGEEYGSTRDLMERMERAVRSSPGAAVVHAAAVGDYEAEPFCGKIPSGSASLTLTLRPAPKIADHLRGWGLVGPYVTFKAAPPGTTLEGLEAIARSQRTRTACDLVFANVLGHLGQDVLLVGEASRRFALRDEAVAALVDWLAERLG